MPPLKLKGLVFFLYCTQGSRGCYETSVASLKVEWRPLYSAAKRRKNVQPMAQAMGKVGDYASPSGAKESFVAATHAVGRCASLA